MKSVLSKLFCVVFILFYLYSYILVTPVSATITNLNPLSIFTGEASGDYFGDNIGHLQAGCDINNDNYDDLLIAAPNKNSNTGKVYLFYGSSSGIASTNASNADVTFTGEATSDYLSDFKGLSCGDVNDDNYDDIIMGARRNDDPGDNAGRVYIFYGGSSLTSDVVDQADVILNGETVNTNDQFGISVSYVGDANGDGFGDIIVGSHYNDSGGDKSGRAYIFYGGLSLITKSASSADIIMTGEAVSNQFGWAVSFAGDVNNDGYDDVIVGANSRDAGLGANQGSAYIYYGASNMNNIADVVIDGEKAGDMLGTSVSSAGDVNGDGYDDIIVGTIDNKAYIFYGGSSVDDMVDVIFDIGSEGFGYSVSSAGDINNDGFSDVIIGARIGGVSNEGKAYIYFGGTLMDNVPDLELSNTQASEAFGASVSLAGDVDNDDWQEFLVGTFDFGTTVGRAFLYNLNYASPNVSMNTIGNIEITSTEVTGTASQNGVDIGGVQVRIDGGEWIDCEADDGAFDEESEEFSCSLSGLDGGEHTVEVRSYDEHGVYIPSTLFARETFSVDLPETGNIVLNWMIVGALFIMLSCYVRRIVYQLNSQTVKQINR